MHEMGVSIIICTHNGEETLPKVLDAVTTQDTENQYEVIIVDNNSTDRTSEIAKQYHECSPGIVNVIYEEHQGLIHARRAGVTVAKFPLISFLDDDNIVESKWVQKCCDFFSNPGHSHVGAVGSNNEAVFDTTEPDWFQTHQAYFACGPQGKKTGPVGFMRPFVFGAGMTGRKDLILKAMESKAFLTGRSKDSNLLLSGDDSEISMKIMLQGYSLYYFDDLHLKHLIHKSRLTKSYLEDVIIGVQSTTVLSIYYFLKIIKKEFLYNRLTLFLFASLILLVSPIRIMQVLFKTGKFSTEPYFHAVGLFKGYFYFWDEIELIKKY